MGKYEFKHNTGSTYDRGYLIPHLNNIANELAEANRLKRLELSQIADDRMSEIKDVGKRVVIYGEDLEDKA